MADKYDRAADTILNMTWIELEASDEPLTPERLLAGLEPWDSNMWELEERTGLSQEDVRIALKVAEERLQQLPPDEELRDIPKAKRSKANPMEKPGTAHLDEDDLYVVIANRIGKGEARALLKYAKYPDESLAYIPGAKSLEEKGLIVITNRWILSPYGLGRNKLTPRESWLYQITYSGKQVAAVLVSRGREQHPEKKNPSTSPTMKKVLAKDLKVGDRFKAFGPSDQYGEVRTVISVYPPQKTRHAGRINWLQQLLVEGVHGIESATFASTDKVWVELDDTETNPGTLKVKRVASGVYDVTDSLGRQYDVSQVEGGMEWKIWAIDGTDRQWADTVGTLREAKESIVTWADRDAPKSNPTRKLKAKLLR